MSYDAAKLTVQQLSPAKSRREYYIWHRKARPVGLPRFPHRVYLNEWKGWAEFLGTDNVFAANRSREYRPYWEAVRFVQTLGLKNANEYVKAYEEGKVPRDIPKAPQKWYDNWSGWVSFLGKDVQAKIDVAKQEVGIIGLCDVSGMPVGYVEVVYAEKGMQEFVEKVREKQVRVHQMWKWERDKTELVKRIILTFGSPQGGGVWLIRNIPALIFELDQVLEWAKRP